MHQPDEKQFSFNDFVKALEDQHSGADLEPYGDLLNELAKELNVDYKV